MTQQDHAPKPVAYTSTKARCVQVLLVSLVLLATLHARPRSTHAQEPIAETAIEQQVDVFEAEILSVLDERIEDMGGTKQLRQSLELKLTSGDDAGRIVVVENGQWAAIHVPRYSAGDRVLVERSFDPSGEALFYVTDHIRRGPLLWLFGVFVLVSVGVGRLRGVASLVGMGLSFLLIFVWVLPQIGAGHDPIVVAILAAAIIIPVSFYLSHGVNWKTTAAVLGTLITLILTGALAEIAVDAAKLTGFASEEAYFLQASTAGNFNVRGLLLASIIIGLLGILDDITISQAAIVQQLRRVSPERSLAEIYGRSMDVGRDHIASLVNTLVLVYVSSAMPLLLLFYGSETSFLQAINYEVVAEEVVRTLVASIGLIAAVPLTTAIACFLAVRGAFDAGEGVDPHAHHGHSH